MIILKHKLNFYKITYPILVDNSLRIIGVILLNWLINHISDQAVAVTFLANTFLLFAFSIIECFAQSCMTTITQYRGAGLNEQAICSGFIIVFLNFLLGLFISVFFYQTSYYLISLISNDIFLIKYGALYLQIISCGYWAYGISYAFLCILNSYGKTIISMFYSLLINFSIIIITAYIILIGDSKDNYCLLEKIAKTHFFIRFLGLIFLFKLILNLNIRKINFKKILLNLSKEGKVLLNIGTANLLESFIYHMNQLFLAKIIASIGISALIIRGYIMNISIFLELIPLALSKGNQIIAGYFIGNQKFFDTDNQTKKSMLHCFVLSSFIALFVFFFRLNILNIFTYDQSILEVSNNLILLCVIIMWFKCINFNLISTLKAAADYKFLTYLFLFMFILVAMPFSFLMIKYSCKNIYFIWGFLILEEFIKMIFLFSRWKMGKWKKNILIQKI